MDIEELKSLVCDKPFTNMVGYPMIDIKEELPSDGILICHGCKPMQYTWIPCPNEVNRDNEYNDVKRAIQTLLQ